MRIHHLRKLLAIFPDDMEVFLQTCEGDFATPLDYNHMSTWDAHNDEKYGMQTSKLILTAFIKGEKRYSYENQRGGFTVVGYEDDKLKQKESDNAE